MNNPARFTDPSGHMADKGEGGDYTWKDRAHDEYLRLWSIRRYWEGTNAWELMAGDLRHEPHMNIVGHGLELIKNDPEIERVQDKLILRIMKDPRFGVKEFTADSIGNQVQLGQHGVDAFNGATWMQRNASLDATDVQVSKDGAITISWQTHDALDLNPDWGGPRKGPSGFFYNLITAVTGGVWHGLLGASSTMSTGASWQVTTYPYCK
jgi:hypothetical protein